MSNTQKEYIEKLENVVKQIVSPLRVLPPEMVLDLIYQKETIAFDEENPKHKKLLGKLKKAAQLACQNINDSGGILSARANEVGNKIELPIKLALQNVGLKDADVPVNKRGVKQSSGYPDLGFSFGDSYVYVECKTYNKKNVATTQRSFFLSPTEAFKVTKDAIHIVISLEMEQKSAGVFTATAWKIVQIENIDVDVKREFNSDNKRMYSPENILADGKI